MSQPTGTVTLLFTDVEGSTRLLERLGTEPYAAVLEQHRRLLREAFTENEGYEFGSALRARTCSRVSAGSWKISRWRVTHSARRSRRS